MRHTVFVETIIVIAALCLSGGIQAGETPANPDGAPMTFADLLQKGMTPFVDKEFTLKAKVMWRYADVKIPEDPTSSEELRKKAGQVMIPFEGPEFKDVKGKKSIFASGRDLTRTTDAQGREAYAFKDTILSNNDKEYVMTVRLKLRPAFNKSHLENPAFVKQSNNPTYWSQTFEFEIVALREIP